VTSRAVALSGAPLARFLRVTGSHGNGLHLVTELEAFCSPPSPWPPENLAPRRGWLDAEHLPALRLVLALAGLALCGWELVLRRAGRPEVDRLLRRALLLALALLAGLLWLTPPAATSFFVVHAPEQFHYYLGAKYFDELGYDHLYECAAAARKESGEPPPAVIRDLTSRELVPVDAAAQLEVCRGRFTPARWSA